MKGRPRIPPALKDKVPTPALPHPKAISTGQPTVAFWLMRYRDFIHVQFCIHPPEADGRPTIFYGKSVPTMGWLHLETMPILFCFFGTNEGNFIALTNRPIPFTVVQTTTTTMNAQMDDTVWSSTEWVSTSATAAKRASFSDRRFFLMRNRRGVVASRGLRSPPEIYWLSSCRKISVDGGLQDWAVSRRRPSSGSGIFRDLVRSSSGGSGVVRKPRHTWF